jgi:hypothetical protein
MVYVGRRRESSAELVEQEARPVDHVARPLLGPRREPSSGEVVVG